MHLRAVGIHLQALALAAPVDLHAAVGLRGVGKGACHVGGVCRTRAGELATAVSFALPMQNQGLRARLQVKASGGPSVRMPCVSSAPGVGPARGIDGARLRLGEQAVSDPGRAGPGQAELVLPKGFPCPAVVGAGVAVLAVGMFRWDSHQNVRVSDAEVFAALDALVEDEKESLWWAGL